MPPTIAWTQPATANGAAYGLEYYASIIGHYGMILAAIGIMVGFFYMFMLHDPDSRSKGIKIVLGSTIALVFLAFLPSLMSQFFAPSAASFGLTPPNAGAIIPPSGATSAPVGTSWLGNMIGQALSWILGWITASFLLLATGFLNATMFNTVSMVNGSNWFAQTIWHLYNVTAPIATGIIALILAYSFTKQAVGGSLLETGHAFDRGTTDPRILIPRSIAAIVMAWAGYYVVAFLLESSNYFVNFFLAQTSNSIQNIFLSTGGAGSGVAAVGLVAGAAVAWSFFSPILILALVGIVLWVVFTYFVRLFEIVFLTGLLPIAAAFWTMSETSNIWNTYIAELLAAIFLQSLQVFLWFVLAYLLSGSGITSGLGSGLVGGMASFIMGLIGMYFIARAPSILRSFLGHNIAGGQTLGGEVMAAMAMRSMGRGALAVSPGSKVANAIKEGKSQEAEQKVRNWSQQSVKPSIFDKPIGAAGRAAGAMAGTVANYADGFRGGMDAGVGAFAEGGPLGTRFTKAVRAAYRGTQTGSIDIGRVSQFGEAGAAAANFRPTTAAGRIFNNMEQRGSLARSQNELNHAQRADEVPDIAQAQYAAQATRERSASGAMLQRPDLVFQEEMAKQERINAKQNVWTGKSEGMPPTRGTSPSGSPFSGPSGSPDISGGGQGQGQEQSVTRGSSQGATKYAQELHRSRNENRQLGKERRQLSRQFEGQIGQVRMTQATRQAGKEISNTIKQNNSLYQLITSKHPPGHTEEYGYGM